MESGGRGNRRSDQPQDRGRGRGGRGRGRGSPNHQSSGQNAADRFHQFPGRGRGSPNHNSSFSQNIASSIFHMPDRGRGRGRGGWQGLTQTQPSSSSLPRMGSGSTIAANGEIPVFGFRKLYFFLEKNGNEVISQIHKDLPSWSALLSNREKLVNTNSDDYLILVLYVIGEKVCCEDDVLLLTQRNSIISTSLNSTFLRLLEKKCDTIKRKGSAFLDEDDDSDGFNTYTDTVRLTQNSRRTFESLYKFITCVRDCVQVVSANTVFNLLQAAIDALAVFQSVESYKIMMHEFEDVKRSLNSSVTPTSSDTINNLKIASCDFRKIPIIPTMEELLSSEEPNLRRSKEHGAYRNHEHYLDINFRLVRHDFVATLKQGLQDFITNMDQYASGEKRMPTGNIRVYPDVTISSNIGLMRDQFVFDVRLPCDQYKSIKWSTSKRLIVGGLVLFTPDLFKTVNFAKVAMRNAVDLNEKGLFGVVWEGEAPSQIFERSLLMVECEVYFEAYRHTLSVLQRMNLRSFPMYPYIVKATSEIQPAEYLVGKQMKLFVPDEILGIHPFQAEHWPTPRELGLNEKQFEAFRAALTLQLAIIQGPPGTGKTFLGLKILDTLLDNHELWRSSKNANNNGPILVVCRTNHALDQFLEGALDVYTNRHEVIHELAFPPVVRLGARSKSPKLQTLTMYYHRRYMVDNGLFDKTYTLARHVAQKRVLTLQTQHCQLYYEVSELKNLQGIIQFNSLSLYEDLKKEYPDEVLSYIQNTAGLWFLAHFNKASFQEKNFNEESYLKEFCHPQAEAKDKPWNLGATMASMSIRGNCVEEDNSEDDAEQDSDGEVEEIHKRKTMKPSTFINFHESLALSKYQELIAQLNDLRNSGSVNRTQEHQEHNLDKIIRRRIELSNKKTFMAAVFEAYYRGLIELPFSSNTLQNLKLSVPQYTRKQVLESLSPVEALAIYFRLIECVLELTVTKKIPLEEELLMAQKDFDEIDAWGDGIILRKALIVGVTTTAAAKYEHLVHTMKSKILIVEEAADIFEAQVVTSLTKHCEHLILLGDHQQLRPTTALHEMAIKFKLDISLFERMINNKLSYSTLEEQHRMRPEIADLLVGTIYKKLSNAPSVLTYENVKGITKNVYFIDHREMESTDFGSTTKSNKFEADFMVELCHYLILQGYETNQITILTFYSGQKLLIKKTIAKYPKCKRVRVAVVDDFQGEENDIILLSTVRSNVENKTGFLKIDNRICVALSRAKIGLYICGNMELLAAGSKTWSEIHTKLENGNEIGSTLILRCQMHGKLSEVRTVEDFLNKVPLGGCDERCNKQLKCGHKCTRSCQGYDLEHNEYVCMEQCLITCKNGHPCPEKCYVSCPPSCNVIENINSEEVLCGATYATGVE